MPHLKARLSVSSVRQLSVHSSDSESNQAKDLRMDDTYRLTRSKRKRLHIQPQCVTPAAIARAYSVSALAVVALSKVPLALLTAWSCHYMALRRIWKLVFFPNTTNQLFDFPTDAQYLSLDMEGRESQQGPTPAIVPTKLAFILSPEARQLQPATSSRRITAGEQSINVKIIQANFSHQSNGRPEFNTNCASIYWCNREHCECELYFERYPEKMGDDMVLVTADDLKIDDRSRTQGKLRILYSAPMISVPLYL